MGNNWSISSFKLSSVNSWNNADVVLNNKQITFWNFCFDQYLEIGIPISQSWSQDLTNSANWIDKLAQSDILFRYDLMKRRKLFILKLIIKLKSFVLIEIIALKNHRKHSSWNSCYLLWIFFLYKKVFIWNSINCNQAQI